MNYKREDGILEIDALGSKYYMCYLCGIALRERDIERHLSSKEHIKERVIKKL